MAPEHGRERKDLSLREHLGFRGHGDSFRRLGHIVEPGELSISFLLDEKPTVVPVGSAGERSGEDLIDVCSGASAYARGKIENQQNKLLGLWAQLGHSGNLFARTFRATTDSQPDGQFTDNLEIVSLL